MAIHFWMRPPGGPASGVVALPDGEVHGGPVDVVAAAERGHGGEVLHHQGQDIEEVIE